MGGLHRLSHHPHQIVTQGIEVSFIPELGGEGLQGLCSVVLPPVEAAVHKPLHPTAQRVEQRRYQERGGHHSEGRFLAREDDEDSLQHNNAAEVEGNQRGSESTVDERTVDDDVDIVEAVAEDGY